MLAPCGFHSGQVGFQGYDDVPSYDLDSFARVVSVSPNTTIRCDDLAASVEPVRLVLVGHSVPSWAEVPDMIQSSGSRSRRAENRSVQFIIKVQPAETNARQRAQLGHRHPFHAAEHAQSRIRPIQEVTAGDATTMSAREVRPVKC